jgi:LPS sulfotransferase NodH
MNTETWFQRFRRKIAGRILGSLPVGSPPPELSPIEPAHLAEIQAVFPLPKFFIFGYPRSGTTLLMRLVRIHPRVYCQRQAHFFTHPVDATQIFADNDIREWLSRRSNRWTAEEPMAATLVRLIADYLMEREAHRQGASTVGDKSPNTNHGQAVRRMHAVYPDGRLIYIVRDGRDAVLSHRFMHFIDQPHLLNRADRRIKAAFARESDPFFQGTRSVFTRSALDRLAQEWAQNVTETHRLGQDLFGDRYLSLRFEDLLEAPVAQVARVWDFLQVDPDFPDRDEGIKAQLDHNPSADWHREKNEALVRDLERGKQGSWRDLFTDQDRQIFLGAAGQALADWGYAEPAEI